MSRFVEGLEEKHVKYAGFVENAIITKFYFEAGGSSAVVLSLKIRGGGQAFQCVVGEWDETKEDRIDDLGLTYEVISAILKLTDSQRTDELVGKPIRITKRKDSWDTISGLGHIIEDKWFFVEPTVNRLRSEQ